MIALTSAFVASWQARFNGGFLASVATASTSEHAVPNNRARNTHFMVRSISP